MPHFETDPLTPSNTSFTLTPALELLAPIRQHRLQLAEFAWQRQNAVLSALHTRLEKLACELRQLREGQRQTSQEQCELHANRRLPLNEINTWLAQERQALEQIEKVEQNFHTLQEEYSRQREWTEESRKQLQRRRRDMEKLNYIRNLPHGAL